MGRLRKGPLAGETRQLHWFLEERVLTVETSGCIGLRWKVSLADLAGRLCQLFERDHLAGCLTRSIKMALKAVGFGRLNCALILIG